QRRHLRHGSPRAHALGGAGAVWPVSRRVGHLDRPHRRHDLPLRPRRALGSGSPQAGGERGTLSVSVPEGWLEDHPYLRPLAAFCGRVEAAVAGLGLSEVVPPEWAALHDDLEAGIPLLSSAAAGLDLEPTAARVGDLVRRLHGGSLDGPIA